MTRATGPRGLSKQAILDAALILIEDTGPDGFSLRKLAGHVGCDPMALIYHFGSKDGLFRQMADRLTARLAPAPSDRPWPDRLRQMARACRALALSSPCGFALIQRFWNTGTADFAQIEAVQRALSEAGVPRAAAPALCLGWYAAVIGLCMAETGGLIRRPTEREAAEIAALPEAEFPLLRALLPDYQAIDGGAVFDAAVDLLITGIAALGQLPRT